MNATTLNLNPTTLQLRGTTITASAAEINYLSTFSPGTVGNSKGIVVDSLGSIAGLNSLNCVSVSTSGNITAGGVINGSLGYANQAAITTVGPLTELGINSTAISKYIRVQASGLDYLDGSYTQMVRFLGANLTPVEFQIKVNNGPGATTTNAAWIGTRTANDLKFGTNDSSIMIISAAGRVGIGTTTPSYQLHVSGSVSSSIDAGGSGVAYFLRSGGLVSTNGPLSSIQWA
ncbi:hypothetical protein PC110_g7327 [Phytophthora cactorum]|uniref:Uncharacterized protein n=1 Tax=Phytophthora cactorum TaxID=29920 RepID=A0A329SI65_9STRA|nr:hypothetical protein PC110_g7327 [Phytophthora cactorum]